MAALPSPRQYPPPDYRRWYWGAPYMANLLLGLPGFAGPLCPRKKKITWRHALHLIPRPVRRNVAAEGFLLGTGGYPRFGGLHKLSVPDRGNARFVLVAFDLRGSTAKKVFYLPLFETLGILLNKLFA